MARSTAKTKGCFGAAIGMTDAEAKAIGKIAEAKGFKTTNVEDDYARATQQIIDQLKAKREAIASNVSKLTTGSVATLPAQDEKFVGDTQAVDDAKADAAPVATAPTPQTPNAEPTPAKKKPTKQAQSASDREKARAEYFTPGNIVKSYGGHDEVLSYQAPDKPGGQWGVTVHAMVRKDGQWMRSGKPQDARTHSTQPSENELQAGPVAKLGYLPGNQVVYTEARADGKQFPNAVDRGVKAAQVSDIQAAETEKSTDQPEESIGTDVDSPDTRPTAESAPIAAPEVKTQPAKTEAPTKINDFGEKIGGAKKDIWTGFKDDMSAVADDEIAERKLSEIFPAPDYQKMIDDGMDAKSVAVIRALRDEIPAKPRNAYKLSRWAEQVKTMRDMATNILNGKDTGAAVVAQLERGSSQMRGIAGRIDLYQTVGHGKSLEGIRLAHHHYSFYRGKENVSLWVVEQDAAATAFSNFPRELATGDTKEDAIDAFKARYAELDLVAAVKKASFDIYSQDGKFFIGKKIGRNIAEMAGPFATLKETREYRTNNLAALDAKLAKYKEIPNERRDSNEPRVGEDMRNGQDVTPEMFIQSFGFKGVEFGNYVEQKRRQKDLNDSFDALMDMAAIIGVPAKALSLNGELGLAFGARGSGGVNPAAAHYESDKIVINLTKREGAGSLGHEFWHALDNYFSRMRGNKTSPYMTTATDVSLSSKNSQYVAYPGVRKEMIDAFGDVVRAIKNTAIKARSSKMDAKRTKDYWTTGEEMSARAFESYLISKLQDQNASNDYLANVVDQKTWDAMAALGMENEDSYPYPTAGEMPVIREGFDKFFRALETKETDKGVAMFSTRESAPEKKLTLAQVERLVKSAMRGIKSAPVIRVVANPEAIGLRTPDNVVPTGVVLASGDIYVFHTGVGSALDVDKIVFHELFHKGLLNSMPAADYVAAMQEIAKSDDKVRQYASEWSDSPIAKSQLDELAKKYSGQELADRYEALAIEEALAMIAEDLKANREMGSKPMRVRRLAEWLAKMADKIGMTRLADSIRAMSYTDAEKFVVDTIGKAGSPQQAPTSYSRADDKVKAGGQPAERVQSLVDRITARWANIPKVIVVQNFDDPRIPEAIRKDGKAIHDRVASQANSTDKAGAPDGFIDSKTGTVYLIADMLAGDADVVRVLMHESLGHFGLRGVFGALLGKILDRMAALNVEKVKIAAERLELDYNNPAQRRMAAEEVLSYMAQNIPELGWVKKAVAAIRSWARNNIPGFTNMRMSDDELIRNFIIPARNWVEKGGPEGGGGGNSATRKADSTGKVATQAAYSQSESREEATALAELSKSDELYSLPKSTKTSLEDIAADNVAGVKVRTTRLGAETMHTLTFDDGEIARITERPANPYGQDKQVYGYDLDKGNEMYNVIAGRPGENPEDVPPTDDVWLDVSLLKKGERGAQAYNIAATFAHNNGKIFIGDPSGLSDAALRRRTEQMISSALKFGTTEHLAPHPRQVAGSSELGVPPLKWIYGDHEGNIERMIDVSMKAMENAFPDVKHIKYDPGTGEFLGRANRPVSRAVLLNAAKGNQAGARPGNLAPAEAGWRTIARHAVFASLLEMDAGKESQRGRLLDRLSGNVARIGARQDGGGAYETRDRIFYSRGNDGVGDQADAAKSQDFKAKFGNRLADFRGMALQTLGRRQLVDIYSKDLPLLEDYSAMVAQMDADKNESGAEADAVATDWGNLKDERQLAELMHDATLAQIDPDKAFVSGDDRNFYDALKHGFDQLTPEAQAAYRKARDMYVEHNDKVRQAIRDRIERSELSPAKRKALLEKMDGEFFKKVKGVYFPLARFGQYVTVVKDSEGNVVSANRSETLNEAEETRRILLRQFPLSGGFKVGKVLKEKEFNAARDGVGRGFMADLFETLDKTNAGEELIDSISQLYLAALPDLSWAKHGIHRKGTPGFSQDARRAFAQNMFHGARYLAKLRYADQLQTHLDDMQEHVASKSDDEGFDSVKAQQVVDEMVKRHEAMMNPKANPVSTALTSFGFIFHLGLSPASALVNLSQTALVALPVMGARWGFAKSSAALLAASKQAAGNKNDISKVLNGEELAAYNEAVRTGAIDVTMAHDLAGIAQGEDSKVSAKIRPVMKWASFLFHHAEKFNRQVTFVAAYRLAKEAGSDHKNAYAEAIKAMYDGHFDYSASNRPRLLQGNWQKVILLFKQYAQNMIYTLSRQAYLSIKGETKAEQAEARKALAGLLVSHAMAAGVLGLPMVGMLLSAASMIGGDDDEPWDAKTALQNMLADTIGQKPAEVVAHGLSRLTPWDISGRVGLDKLLLPDIQEGLSGTPAAQAWLAGIAGPVAGIGINWVKGLSEMGEGQYQRGMESMMPTALRGPLKAYRYANEGNVDKSGVAINDEVSAAGIVGQALGLSPSETRLAQEGKSAIYSADKAIQNRRSDLVRQFSVARMANDSEGQADARKAIVGFNKKNPNARITQSHLVASVKARQKRINQARMGVYLPSKRQDAMEAGRFADAEQEVM